MNRRSFFSRVLGGIVGSAVKLNLIKETTIPIGSAAATVERSSIATFLGQEAAKISRDIADHIIKGHTPWVAIVQNEAMHVYTTTGGDSVPEVREELDGTRFRDSGADMPSGYPEPGLGERSV